MNEKEHNFEDLKRLLKLKQHEVPPPGYFNHLSGRVIARIRAGEAGGSRSIMDRLAADSPWVVSLLRIFETRPGVIGAFATSLCLLLVFVVVSTERSERASRELITLADPTAATAPASSMNTPTVAAASDSTGIVASTNPVTSLQPVATLFNQQPGGSLFQPAGFGVPAH
jgi:hypothetical protein